MDRHVIRLLISLRKNWNNRPREILISEQRRIDEVLTFESVGSNFTGCPIMRAMKRK